ncbi:hypothetical protein [Brevibacillus parabrevis]|uniref:hypothetical protein n=1 Tax=Brevibacillus parabrevis TaxID=54914 RepID=UPI0026CCA96A|nr:hypothetical protein [Brevibacillus parabrevis]MED1721379.1 hypothetical protein [Brevibacillus parabrevis]
MKTIYKNFYLWSGCLLGALSSILSIYLWYVATIRDGSIKGMPYMMIFFILLPACFALISSLVNPPVILISFVWSSPLSLYMLFTYSNIGVWFGVTCICYLVSAVLKFQGLRHEQTI